MEGDIHNISYIFYVYNDTFLIFTSMWVRYVDKYKMMLKYLHIPTTYIILLTFIGIRYRYR